MRSLVIGANGMLGRAVVTDLRGAGHEVVTADLQGAQVEADITELAGLRRACAAARPDVVINCAAFTDVDGAERQRELAHRVNGLGPRNLAICCHELRARLVQISTDYVFDGSAKTPYAELAPPNPKGVYGKSKLLGEWAVQRFCRRFAIVRTAWLFGAGGKNFISAILSRARAGEPLRVVDDQVGAPTYAPHLARCLTQLAQGEHDGIFHATASGQCSWFELARHVLARTGLQGVSLEAISSSELGRPAPRPAYSVLDDLHLRLEGIAPLPSWQEGVAAYLDEIG